MNDALVKLKDTEGQWSSREKDWQNNKIRLEQELQTKTDMVIIMTRVYNITTHSNGALVKQQKQRAYQNVRAPLRSQTRVGLL